MVIGHLSGAWAAPDGAGEQQGHLALAQEFIPGVQDAWRVALLAAASGTDFTDRAYELGVATAEIHATLADRLGLEPASQEARAALVASMHERSSAALAVAPGLSDREAEISAVFDAILRVPWPDLQRIHGDYHLGQVLDVTERGWVALDFERRVIGVCRHV